MKHLSAESALYCRIYIEGLLGIEPTGFSELTITPSLPKEWDYVELNACYLFGKPHDIKIQRKGEKLQLSIRSNNKLLYKKKIIEGTSLKINI